MTIVSGLFILFLILLVLLIFLVFYGIYYLLFGDNNNNHRSGFGKKRKRSSKGATKRTNEKLWKKTVARVKKGSKGGKPGQWSARKAQLAVQQYKKAGGKYSGKAGKNNSLRKWTREDWGTKSGKNSVVGKKATGERYLPKKARQKLSKKEYAATTRRKRRAMKRGKQYSKQPRKIARKTRKYR